MKLILFSFLLFAVSTGAQVTSGRGAQSFSSRCAVCHGGDGNGNERAPSISSFVSSNSDEQIAALIRKGVRAMPLHQIEDSEMKDLLGFVHSLASTSAAIHVTAGD